MSFLMQGLFKNTEDTPVIVDEEDDQHVPDDKKGKNRCVDLKGKNKSVEVKGEPKKLAKNPRGKKSSPLKKSRPPSKGKNVVNPRPSALKQPPSKGKSVVHSAKKKNKRVRFKTSDTEEDEEKKFEDEDDEIAEESGSESSESLYDSSEERIALSSRDEDDSTYPEFNEEIDMDDPQFKIGMLFINGPAFRAAIRKHAIVNQRPVRLRKNHGKRIKWICSRGCKWKVYATQQQRSSSFQIRALHKQHTCNPTWDQKQVNSTWIAREYEDEIRMNPDWPVASFRSKVVNDLKCNISDSMIYRALRKAKEVIKGKHEEEFKKVYDYGNQLLKEMPTSTVKVMTEHEADATRFKRLYVCLGPLKEGFIHYCRPLIGLDGCHLKGPYGGILLTAVATDPNDGIFPLAWAWVEAENNDSWEWFISLLKADLRIENSGAYTFISDRQKVNSIYVYFLLINVHIFVWFLCLIIWF